MKKLPIGIQTLRKIIEKDYVYVDKTEIAYKILSQGQYYFLSRPRRFGKSLFIDTLKEIVEGNQSLFEGLYIHDNWDFNQIHPVIHLDFSIGYIESIAELNKRVRFMLKSTERNLTLSVETQDAIECFQELIWQAYEKTGRQVVILVDEYDKPILDHIVDKEKARMIRDWMKGFYTTIKYNDPYLRLVFITGVSKFSKMHLFRG